MSHVIPGIGFFLQELSSSQFENPEQVSQKIDQIWKQIKIFLVVINLFFLPTFFFKKTQRDFNFQSPYYNNSRFLH